MDTLEIVITACSILVSIGISYGIISTKVKHIERRVTAFEKDHDLLVELNTKMDLLLSKKVK